MSQLSEELLKKRINWRIPTAQRCYHPVFAIEDRSVAPENSAPILPLGNTFRDVHRHVVEEFIRQVFRLALVGTQNRVQPENDGRGHRAHP